MKILSPILAILLTILATIIMTYISMVTPIGPWVETTMVLAGLMGLSLIRSRLTFTQYSHSLGLSTAASGIAGILATGIGFSFPTLYFIAPEYFAELLAHPLQFCLMVGALSLSAGSFGFLVARLFQDQLLNQEKMPFVVGELVYKMISAQDQLKKAISLTTGFLLTQMFLFVQAFTQYVPKSVNILTQRSLGIITLPRIDISLETLPMFWAIGFVTGHVIVWPLAVGLLVRILCMEPLHHYFNAIQAFVHTHIYAINVLDAINMNDFTIAFCSGMVLYNAVTGFAHFPKFIRNAVLQLSPDGKKLDVTGVLSGLSSGIILELVFVLGLNLLFFWYYDFSFLYTLYLLAFTFICTYQLLVIAGKIGLAPLGRFATFVLIPGLMLFGYNPIQATIVSSFVEIAGGVGADMLFGQKMAQLLEIRSQKAYLYQWLGLIVCSLSIGIIAWLFISKLGIGDTHGALPVVKAKARGLLLNVKSFNMLALFLGGIISVLLSFTRVNTMLALGGILMPQGYALMLIAGGLSTYLVKNKEEHYPFWSGVFASNSLWMLIRIFFTGVCR